MGRGHGDRGAINIVAVGVALAAAAITLAGWWAYTQITEASGPNPQGIDITLTATRGARDVNRVPFAIIDYQIDYQSDPLTAAPLVRCEITQVQTSGTRRFLSPDAVAPINTRVVTGTVTISAGADNIGIEGEYDVRCQLIRGEQAIDTATGSVDVPAPDADPADLSLTGRYSIRAPQGSSCQGEETYDFSYNLVTRLGKFATVDGPVVDAQLGDDLSFSFVAPVRVENPYFGGTVTGRFVTTIDRVSIEGTVALTGTVNPDCTFTFSAPRQ